MVEHSGAARGRGYNGGAVAGTDPRFRGASRHADRRDDDPDRAGPYHRPSAREAGMDRDARAPARPPFGTPQTRPKAASGAGHPAASAAAVT